MSILHEYTATGGHLCILEGGVTVLSFRKVDVLLPLQRFGYALRLLVTCHSAWRGAALIRHLRF